MEIGGVVFDLDGVIIDSIQIMKQAFDHSYQHCVGSGKAPFDMYCSYMGKPIGEIFTLMGLPKSMIDVYQQYCIEHEDLIVLNPGINNLIRALYSCGMPMSVFTGKDRYRTKRILERFELQNYFQALVTGDDITNGKPDPEGLNKISDDMGIDSNRLVMIGDSPLDIQCGKCAGARTIAVSWGFGREDELIASQPDHFVRTSHELKELLLTKALS